MSSLARISVRFFLTYARELQLIISYRHVRIELAEHLLLPCDSMAPSILGPVTLMQDKPPIANEICSIRPLDMSLGDTTYPSTW